MNLRKVALFLLSISISLNTAAETAKPKDLLLVGSASLNILWWDIYDSELYNTTGKYNGNQGPLMLSFTYRRDIQSKDLIEETESQWQRFKLPQDKQAKWLKQLDRMWPDVSENDNITFYIDEKNHGHFYFNKDYLGRIEDPQFSEAFIKIWLADNGPHPSVTRGLTNSKKKRKRKR